jgi:hypothetical protein
MAEYLSPEEVDELKLPRLNLWAKHRQIGALAAQMIDGVPELTIARPRTQSDLYMLSQRRMIHDRVQKMLDDQAGTLSWAEEKLLEIGIQIGEDPDQLTLEISGDN